MIALILAAQVATTAAPPIAERTPNLYSQPGHCPSVVEQEVHRQQTALHGRLPAAQYAVLRRLDGCSVPTPVGYHPGYLLPGAADPGAKREDAPENRR
jgi:hypothetical protein